MKKIIALVLCVLLTASFAACSCKHQWTEANCLEPKICTVCGEKEGEALGHRWEEASCDAPKTCSGCGLTEGEALGHNWQEATTEAPKTCTVCAATEGERIVTDARFTTAACSPLFGDWSGQITLPAAAAVGVNVEGEVVFDVVFTYCNDGTVIQHTRFADWESVKPVFVDAVILNLYLEYMFKGMDNPAAEKDIMDQYGMTMEEYAKAYVETIDPDAVNGDVSMVYYVEGDSLNTAMTWDDKMEVFKFTIEGDTLTLIDENGEPMVLTKMAD